MKTSLSHRPRFPSEIISHSVWLYFRFCLSYQDIEEIMAVRGVTLTDDTVRDWCRKFGQTFANELRRRRPKPGDKWHLDEMFIRVNGRIHYLWRAVDQEGEVLDILVQRRRDKQAAKKFTRRAAEGAAVCRESYCHRSAQELQCGEGRDPAECRTPPAARAE